MWQIWKARNPRNFNGDISKSSDIISMSLFEFQECESISFTMPSPTLLNDHTTNNTMIVAQDVMIMFAGAILK